VAVVLAAIVGIATVAWVYYPALMSPDSISMYRDALTGVLHGDRKMPLTAFLWAFILRVHEGPFPLLLFQNLIFWSGLALVVRSCGLSPAWSATAVLAIGAVPPVFALLGTLWADVLLGAFLVLFLGMALLARDRGSRSLLLLSLVPLWCGLAARTNGLPAVVPLAVWWAALWLGIARPERPRAGRVALHALLLLVMMVGATRLFVRAVVTGGTGASARGLQFSMFHDLAGISVHSGTLHLPAYVHRAIPGFTLDTMRAVYDPADVNKFVYNPGWRIEMFTTTDPVNARELRRTWWHAVRVHPGAYLRRRVDAITTGLQLRGVHYPFHAIIDSNDLGLVHDRRPVTERVLAFHTATRGLFFRGWLFLLASGAVVVAGWRHRRWSAVAAATSGICYVAPVALISAGADFRYIWWMIIATLVGALLLARDGGLPAPAPAGTDGIP
jgi:hypothetical protein